MPLSRLLTGLGGLAVLIGLATIAYAHVAVAPDLQRSVDVARRLADDAAGGVVALAETAAATDAVRRPTADVTSRTVALAAPAIAMLDALSDTLHEIPGTGGGVRRLSERVVPGDREAETDGRGALGASIAKLRRAVDALVEDTRQLRRAAVAMDDATRRHDLPSFQPVLGALGMRVDEIRGILADTNPARGMTLLADLIAGLYVVLGIALILVGRATRAGGIAGS